MAVVKSGLKVGQTFEDNGIKYTVVKVLSNGNYISKKVVKEGGKGKNDADTTEKNDADTE